MKQSSSSASGRGALAELKEAVTNLFEQVVGMAPDLGTGREYPRHELRVEEDGYLVRVELPGVRRDAVEVSVSGQALTVSGKRPRFEPPEDGRILRRERRHGRFDLTVRLPSEVDEMAVVAQMRDGMLEIQLPRRTGTRGRSIKVQGPEGTAAPETGGQPSGPAAPERGSSDPVTGGGGPAPDGGDAPPGGMPWEQGRRPDEPSGGQSQ